MERRHSKYKLHELVNEGDRVTIPLMDEKDAQRIRSAVYDYSKRNGMRLRVRISQDCATVVYSYPIDGGKPKPRSKALERCSRWNMNEATRFSDLQAGQSVVIHDIGEAEAMDFVQDVRKYAKAHGWKIKTRRKRGGGVLIRRLGGF